MLMVDKQHRKLGFVGQPHFSGAVFQGATYQSISRSSAKIAVAMTISFGWVFVNGSVALLALTALRLRALKAPGICLFR